MRFKKVKFNIPLLLLSFLLAFGIWYNVVVSDQVDVQVDVQVEYKNIPDNLVITDGLINSIDIRLRGPGALISDIPLASRTHVVDLSKLQKGKNVIPFVYLRKKNLRAFEVQSIEPQRLVLMADTMQERNVNIQAKVKSALHASKFQVSDVSVTPSSVLVRGPSNTISNINNIPLIVRVDTKANTGEHSQVETLDIPHANVTVRPSTVTVSYKVLSERKTVDIKKHIVIEAQRPQNYSIEPSQIEMKIEAPESLAENSGYLQGAKLSVTPPVLEIGESALVNLLVTLPEGMTLVENLPKVITVNRLK